MVTDLVRPLVARLAAFEAEAHGVLAAHESSRSRVVIIEDSYRQLAALSVQQDDLLRQALRCAENGLFRAAHVMAWAAFMDFIEEKLQSDGLAKLRARYSAWAGKDIAEMREHVSEYQLLEATRELGLCTKNETKALHGLLQRRNECAHPSDYHPGLNETLGYLAELLQRIALLQPRTL